MKNSERTTVPNLQKQFLENPEAAREFLESRQGVLLHELGHCVAANIDGLVSGHIIIADIDHRDCTGAFHISPVSRQHLERSPARRELTSSAGALAEVHFCQTSVLRRLGPDIHMYFGPNFARQVSYQVRREVVIMLWREDHLDQIERHADCIEDNFERCVAYMSSKRYLIGDFHIIPTSALISPQPRSVMERLDDRMRTSSKRARERALKEYLDALNDLRTIA